MNENLDAKEIIRLGNMCASSILRLRSDKKIDGIYAPTYRGIVIATSASMLLWNTCRISLPLLYLRKEKKKHGDLKESTIVGIGSLKDTARILNLKDMTITSLKTIITTRN